MIIETQLDVTRAVLAELDRTPDTRFKEIMSAAVRHLHAFAREVRLTEAEYHEACAVIARLGQLTTDSHNEVVLCGGSLGMSSLVCLLNNGDQGQIETTANLMGPFWRDDAPATSNGASLIRSPTPGVPIFVNARVRDRAGRPVADARVDVWHTCADGYYENQDPVQADMNLRGRLRTDADGRIAFRSVKPAGYPIPVGGPVGALLRAQGRHNLRPAHIHFMIHKPGFKTQFSQVYSSDDPNLQTDAQFGVTRSLIGRYVLHDENEPAPAPNVDGPWYSLDHEFVIEPGEAALPRPPIQGKAAGVRPAQVVLERAGTVQTAGSAGDDGSAADDGGSGTDGTDRQRAGVIGFYETHPINEEEILAKLSARGSDLDSLTENQLKDFGQDHYGGVQAVEALAAAAGVRREHHLLDVCSGMGGPARWIAYRYGCRVSGIDFTPSRVAGARRLTHRAKLDHLVEFQQGDATAMPFGSAMFDVVYGQEAWCHIPDKQALITECARVLRPTGTIAFTDILTVGHLHVADESRLATGMHIPRPATLAAYKELLLRNGFAIESTTDLSAEWREILAARLEMYRSLRDTTVARFGEARFAEYDRAYAHFVGLFAGGTLGGFRVVARRG